MGEIFNATTEECDLICPNTAEQNYDATLDACVCIDAAEEIDPVTELCVDRCNTTESTYDAALDTCVCNNNSELYNQATEQCEFRCVAQEDLPTPPDGFSSDFPTQWN